MVGDTSSILNRFSWGESTRYALHVSANFRPRGVGYQLFHQLKLFALLVVQTWRKPFRTRILWVRNVNIAARFIATSTGQDISPSLYLAMSSSVTLTQNENLLIVLFLP